MLLQRKEPLREGFFEIRLFPFAMNYSLWSIGLLACLMDRLFSWGPPSTLACHLMRALITNDVPSLMKG